jgi:AraC-like DNA-binding protein
MDDPVRSLESFISISFIQPGSSQFTDGLVHRKSAPCLIIAEALEGSYEVRRGAERVRVEPNEVFLAATGEPLTITHHAPTRGGVMQAHWLHAHYTLLEALDISRLLRVPLAVRGAQGRALSRAIHDLHASSAGADLGALERLALRAEQGLRALRLVCEVSQVREEGLDALRFGTRFTPVFAFIRENIARAVAVEDLARAAHLSPSRFHALFAAAMGVSPMRHVKMQRLQLARARLIATEDSMEQIAAATGFANPFHFSREFKAHHGVSPSRYRALYAELLV